MMRNLAMAGAMVALLVSSVAAPATAQTLGPSGVPIVVDPGQEPHRLLRYEWTEGQTEIMSMAMTTALEMSMDGVVTMDMEMPFSAEIESTVTEVLPDGSARWEFVWTAFDFGQLGLSFDADELDVDAAEVSGLTEATTEELDSYTQDFVGITGWTVVDSVGAVLDFGLDLPEAFPEELRGQFDSLGNSVQQLPQEPVGVGARWTTATAVESSGLPLDYVAAFEVLSLDDDGVTLDISTDLGTDLKTSMLEQMPQGVDVDFGRFEFIGAGQTYIEFDHLTPTGENGVAFGLDMSATSTEDGVEETVELQMDMEMSMSVGRIE